MEGKFKTWQKCLEMFTFLLISLSGIYNIICCEEDNGIVIMLFFTAVLLFVIFHTIALFPATWRMSDTEKKKIKDLMQYQEKYTCIVVIVNVVLSIFMTFLIWII